MDLSILKYCPYCDAPMTPTSYNICIKSDEKCNCCECTPPDDLNFDEAKCSVCTKALDIEDFKNKKATFIHNTAICLECLKAKRILQKEKEIFICDFCGEELTPLDFLEDNADVKRMLIVCKTCQNKHFIDGMQEDRNELDSKSVKEKKKKSNKVDRINKVSETAQSLLKTVQATIEEKDKSHTEETVKHDSKIEKHENESDSDATETKMVSHKVKSVVKRFDKEQHLARNFDYRAALGCLVVLVIILSIGIGYLIYTKYSEEENEATQDIAYILRAVRDRQNELTDNLERFGNRLYYLEQLEMNRSSERINNSVKDNIPDEKTDSNDNKSEAISEESTEKDVRISPRMREILDKLDSDKATEKLNAIMDISWENFRGATPKLLDIVRNEKDKYLRVFAIMTLVSFREKELIPLLNDIVFKEKASIVTETAKQALIELEKFSR